MSCKGNKNFNILQQYVIKLARPAKLRPAPLEISHGKTTFVT